jgi:GcrA cell cycle regulator
LAGRAKPEPAVAEPRTRKSRAQSALLRLARPTVRGNTALAYEPEPEAEPEPVDNVIPLGQRRNLLELTEETCRWPIGDPGTADFYFCGGHAVVGLPYCSYHSRVAYQPPNTRRDRRPFKG